MGMPGGSGTNGCDAEHSSRIPSPQVGIDIYLRTRTRGLGICIYKLRAPKHSVESTCPPGTTSGLKPE
jgi:hypothetical protein